MTTIIKTPLYALLIICSIQNALSINNTKEPTKSKTTVNIHDIGGPLQITQKEIEDVIAINIQQGIDAIELYAWSIIYKESHNMSKHILEHLNDKLSEEQIKSANNRVQTFVSAFEKQELIGNYTPAYPYKITKFQAFEIVPLKTVPPKYPIDARMNYIQGYVELGFNIYKDNTVRDIYVVKQYPKHHFTKEAIQAISQYQLNLVSRNIKPIKREYQQATQRIEFKLEGNIPVISTEKLNHLNKQFELAKEGNMKAQQFFLWAYKNYPISFNDKIVKPELINQWMFKLAKDGNTNAQYHLGQAIYNGINCKKEEQKGFDWIHKSAVSGNFDAQYQLFVLIESQLESPEDYDFINNTNQDAGYWLQKAANKGSLIAKFMYAKKLAFSKNTDSKEVELALQYLEKYINSYGDMPQTYQIKAFLLKKLGKNSKAKSAINKQSN